MKPNPQLGESLRDQLFVLAWIAVAVFAKYASTADALPEARNGDDSIAVVSTLAPSTAD